MSVIHVCAAIALAFCTLFSGVHIVHADAQARYVGEVVTRWENDGRLMTLVEPFQYIDRRSRRWSVPRGIAIDGASIPSVFWSLIGGPFEGRYRNASIVHDYYCDTRMRRWQDVHLVFYEAMLTSGVGETKALVLYKAVEKFGPRWPEPVVDPKCRKSDGSLDYSKCTENNGYKKGDVVWPKAGKDELRKFLSEISSVANPEDIEKLRGAIEER